MESVSIAHRALVLRRGLSDRAPSVRNASVEMLKRWLEAFDGDVVKLLVALDVETNEEEAELAVKELIDIGRVKPMETCKSAEAVAKGLKRDFNAEGLLTSEEALYWRMILQHLARVRRQGIRLGARRRSSARDRRRRGRGNDRSDGICVPVNGDGFAAHRQRTRRRGRF